MVKETPFINVVSFLVLGSIFSLDLRNILIVFKSERRKAETTSTTILKCILDFAADAPYTSESSYSNCSESSGK